MAMQLPEKFQNLPYADELAKFIEDQIAKAVGALGQGKPQSGFMESSQQFPHGGFVTENKMNIEENDGPNGDFARVLEDRANASAIVKGIQEDVRETGRRKPLRGMRTLAKLRETGKFSARKFVDEFVGKASKSRIGKRIMARAGRIRQRQGAVAEGKLSVMTGLSADPQKPVTMASWTTIESPWIRSTDEANLGAKNHAALDQTTPNEILKGPGAPQTVEVMGVAGKMSLPNTADAMKEALTRVVHNQKALPSEDWEPVAWEEQARKFTQGVYYEMEKNLSNRLSDLNIDNMNMGYTGGRIYSQKNGIGMICGQQIMRLYNEESTSIRQTENQVNVYGFTNIHRLPEGLVKLAEAWQENKVSYLSQSDNINRGNRSNFEKGHVAYGGLPIKFGKTPFILTDNNGQLPYKVMKPDLDNTTIIVRGEKSSREVPLDQFIKDNPTYRYDEIAQAIEADAFNADANNQGASMTVTVDYELKNGKCEFTIKHQYGAMSAGGVYSSQEKAMREIGPDPHVEKVTMPVGSFEEFKEAFSEIAHQACGFSPKVYAPNSYPNQGPDQKEEAATGMRM